MAGDFEKGVCRKAFIRFQKISMPIKYNSDMHRRRSIRLKGFDYSQAGAYFVTVCTYNRECLFGKIEGGEIQLNEAGYMAHKIWNELPENIRA